MHDMSDSYAIKIIIIFRCTYLVHVNFVQSMTLDMNLLFFYICKFRFDTLGQKKVNGRIHSDKKLLTVSGDAVTMSSHNF